jgi:hypothetical protein
MAPLLAMSGAAAAGLTRTTYQTIVATMITMAPVATSHGVRLSSRPVTGRPQRWQKRDSRRSSV